MRLTHEESFKLVLVENRLLSDPVLHNRLYGTTAMKFKMTEIHGRPFLPVSRIKTTAESFCTFEIFFIYSD
jgi:hypothetical protein